MVVASVFEDVVVPELFNVAPSLVARTGFGGLEPEGEEPDVDEEEQHVDAAEIDDPGVQDGQAPLVEVGSYVDSVHGCAY